MGPLEILWSAVAIFFVFIALVRGYPKELGVTTLIFAALFLITFFFDRFLPGLIERLSDALNLNPSPRGLQHFYSFAYSIIFLLIVFSAYAGQTFAFEGSVRKGSEGLLINLAVGLLNGILVAGSLWYFQDNYDYPIADFRGPTGSPLFLTLPLTPLAERLTGLLPPAVIDSIYWGALLMLMLIARVRR